MAMVYGLVKQHKGFVHLYSETGQGTTAKVYFPAVYRRMPLETDSEETLPGGREAILLVGDDPPMRSGGQGLLEKNGYPGPPPLNGGKRHATEPAPPAE